MKLLVEAAGQNADAAVKLIIADKLEDLTRIQVEAIKNIKIDKVTVWDSNGTNDQGKTATANFLSGMLKSIPPMNELFQQAGMELPSYLGKDLEEEKKTEAAEPKSPEKDPGIKDIGQTAAEASIPEETAVKEPPAKAQEDETRQTQRPNRKLKK